MPIEHDPTASRDAERDTDIAVVRFDTTGQLDPTFEINRIMRLDLSTGVVPSPLFISSHPWRVTSHILESMFRRG